MYPVTLEDNQFRSQDDCFMTVFVPSAYPVMVFSLAVCLFVRSIFAYIELEFYLEFQILNGYPVSSVNVRRLHFDVLVWERFECYKCVDDD